MKQKTQMSNAIAVGFLVVGGVLVVGLVVLLIRGF